MRWLSLLIATLALAALASATALGHTERPSYWPDPAADAGVKPPSGGEVPKARSLGSALRKKPPGRTRVVCKKSSSLRARRAIKRARTRGYWIRPSDHRTITAKQARRLRKMAKRFMKRCKFRQIQPAVMKSRNNDRVVIMPGLYTEPTSRSKPTNDPKCEKYQVNGDRPNQEGEALSYEYQVNCPNDQNLIALLGRQVGSGEDPETPRLDRHGIPNVGKCIRCNVQIEGFGPSPDEVTIDSGDASKGDNGPSGVGSKKDVAIRADRADGFVLRNVKVRHAKEHGIYVIESDGYLLDRFKAFYNGLYGTLSFVEDHGVQQNCEAVGHGDSGVYPGAAVESGQQRPEGTPFRYNQEVRMCDLHHNLAGYSGTNGNAVHLHHNNIWDNALGIQTDVATGAGHPGYPGDSMLVEENNIYSNNFNPYADRPAESTVIPAFPFPVGTGMWIAGRQRPRDPQQPHLGQLAPRHDALRRPRRARVWPRRGRERAGRLRSQRLLGLVRQPLPRKRDGHLPGRRGRPQRHRLLVGRVPRQHRQLLVPEHQRRPHHELAGVAARLCERH